MELEVRKHLKSFGLEYTTIKIRISEWHYQVKVHVHQLVNIFQRTFLMVAGFGIDQVDIFNRLSWRLVQAEGSDIQSVLVSTFQTRWFLGPPAHPRGAEFYRRHLSSKERAIYTLPTAWPSSGREGRDWNSSLGQTLLCPQAQREEEMPFHCSPRLRSFQLLCGDLPFLGHLTAGLSIQFHLSG